MICRRFLPLAVSFVLLTSLTVPLVAGTPSEAAFKKLQSLAGQWEGKDARGMASKTSFEVPASGTPVMEKLEASCMVGAKGGSRSVSGYPLSAGYAQSCQQLAGEPPN